MEQKISNPEEIINLQPGEKRYIPFHSLTLWYGFLILAGRSIGKKSVDMRKLSSEPALGKYFAIIKTSKNELQHTLHLTPENISYIEKHSSEGVDIDSVFVLDYIPEYFNSKELEKFLALKNEHVEHWRMFFNSLVSKANKEKIQKIAVRLENYLLAQECKG